LAEHVGVASNVLSCPGRELQGALVTFVQQSAKRLFFAQSRCSVMQFEAIAQNRRISSNPWVLFSKNDEGKLQFRPKPSKIALSGRLLRRTVRSISGVA
jgi:hypothetical protein